jgi:protein phosphatase
MAVEPSKGIVVVADGMGGAPAGDLASALAVQEVARGLHAGEGMKASIQAANRKVRQMAADQPALEGMGSTVTALALSAEEGSFVIGHVGDSRAYRLRGGVLVQLTRDHTVVQDMVDAGRIPRSAERGHPLSHILSRVLGSEEDVDVDLVEGPVKEGDCFLLCTDGLSKVLDDSELELWLNRSGAVGLEELVGEILEEGNRRGAPDNITLAILTAGDPGKP